MSCDVNTKFMEDAFEEGLQEGELIHGLTGTALELYAEKYAKQKFENLS